MISDPEWLKKFIVLAFHGEQLTEHGGKAALRDEGLLDSALERPRNRFAYSEPDLFDLAAAYAYGIAMNRPFIDGNKRTSFIVAHTFLILNGFELLAPDKEILLIWLALADGSLSESVLAEWLRKNSASE